MEKKLKKWKQEILEKMKGYPDICCFDCETTGLNAEKNKVIQLSGYRISYDRVEKKYEIVDRIDQYIRPKTKVPSEITNLTGITNELLKDKPKEAEAFPLIYDFFRDCGLVTGYNVSFDIRFMKKLYERCGDTFPDYPVLDVCSMARDFFPKEILEKRTLENVSKIVTGKEYQYHCAIADVQATYDLFQIFCNCAISGKPVPYDREALVRSNTIPESPVDFTLSNMAYWEKEVNSGFTLKRVYFDLRTEENRKARIFYDQNNRKFMEQSKSGLLDIIPAETLKQEADLVAKKRGFHSVASVKVSAG